MKKFTLFFLSIILFCQLNAQTIIANWTFEDASKRSIVDANNNPSDYSPDQGSGTLFLLGGPTLNFTTTDPITAFPQGSGGAGTYAMNTKGWDAGNGTKYWQVIVSTENMTNITVSSKQKGSNTGPKDFKLQYSVDGTNTWNDVSGATIVVANDNFVSGVLNSVALPEECNNQANLYLRWIMTSNNAVSSTLSATGTNRIDDIIIQGTAQTTNYTVTFGVEGLNGEMKCFVGENEIQSGDAIPAGTELLFKAIPAKGYKIDNWKLNNSELTNYIDLILPFQNLSENIDVRVAFESAVSAEFDRYEDSLDLSNLPEYIDFIITWNDSYSIDSIFTNKGTENEYVWVVGEDYVVIADTLRFLIGGNKSKSQFKIEYNAPITVVFNVGFDQLITIYMGSIGYNVTYSTAQGMGTLDGYTYNYQVDDFVLFNSGDLIGSYFGAYFIATPETNYEIEKWTVNDNDVLDNENNLFTEPNYAIADFTEDQNVKVYFREVTGLNNLDAKVLLSPNPTKDILNISAQNNYKVVISDLRGVKVLNYQMLQNNISLDLSKLSSGVYFVSLIDNNQTKVYKIVKK